MHIRKLEGLFQEILETSHEISYECISENENDIDYSKIIIPFSKVFKSYKPRDIYPGNKKIPFKEKNLEFRMILKQEFSTILKS